MLLLLACANTVREDGYRSLKTVTPRAGRTCNVSPSSTIARDWIDGPPGAVCCVCCEDVGTDCMPPLQAANKEATAAMERSRDILTTHLHKKCSKEGPTV